MPYLKRRIRHLLLPFQSDLSLSHYIENLRRVANSKEPESYYCIAFEIHKHCQGVSENHPNHDKDRRTKARVGERMEMLWMTKFPCRSRTFEERRRSDQILASNAVDPRESSTEPTRRF